MQDVLSQHLSIDGPSTNPDGEAVETSAFEKFDPLLHIGVQGAAPKTRAKSKKMRVLSMAFIKKYIQYAKSKPQPVLTKGAADLIVTVYAQLRNQSEEEGKKRVRPYHLS